MKSFTAYSQKKQDRIIAKLLHEVVVNNSVLCWHMPYETRIICQSQIHDQMKKDSHIVDCLFGLAYKGNDLIRRIKKEEQVLVIQDLWDTLESFDVPPEGFCFEELIEE